MMRISLNEKDFKKLVRGEIVNQGELQVALQDIGHLAIYNAVVDAITTTVPHVPVRFLTLREEDRQMLLLAMAELALSRPGWDAALRAIAQRIDNAGTPMYDEMKTANADRVRAERGPVDRSPFTSLREDEEEVRRWIIGINQAQPTQPGGFLEAFAAAVCRADPTNYPVLRPAVLALKAKFPKYRFTGEL
jgi:hypothetical protein